MEAQLYLNALRRSWWLILLGPILAAGTAFFYSQSLTPIYRTASTLLVNQTQTPGAIQYNDVLTSERLTNTYAALLREQRGYLSSVIEQLDLPLTEDQLAGKVDITIVSNTQLLRVAVEDPSPALAASIANTLADAFITENATQLGDARNLTVAVAAPIPTSPASPNITQNTVLAAILGLIVVSGVAVLMEYLDDTLKAGDETDEAFGLPTLGFVRRLRSVPEGASLLESRAGIDAFTQLRTNIHFAGLGKPLKKLVVTGSVPGEGKTTTAAGLAIALSQAGQRVILVDTDLRRPTLHKLFQVSNSYGITGLLLSRSEDPKNALMTTPHENLLLLPSGPIPANPADLLMSPNWQQLVDKLCEMAHYVVFDTPPVLSVSDASILAGRADGTILVAETGKTRRNAIREALTSLERTNAHVVGIVKNKIRSRKAHYYYYEYSQEPDKRRRTSETGDRRGPLRQSSELAACEWSLSSHRRGERGVIEQRPRLSIVCENYWPEFASTGQLITDLAEGLTRWFEVEVITAQPRYHGDYGRFPATEMHNGVHVRRIWGTRFDKKQKLGRIANWLSFAASLAVTIGGRWRRQTYLYVTNPPTAPWCAMLSRLQGQPSFVLVYDLYPDLAQALHVLSERSWLARAFDKLNVASFRAASGVIALGTDMQARLRAKLGPKASIPIIPNWADGDLISPRSKLTSEFARRNGLADKTVFLYAGNLGLFQDLETLIDAVEKLDDGDDCRLVFVGDGGKRKVVEAAAKRSERVLVFDYQPYAELGDLYAAADAGLIAIEPGVEMVNMPSKTYSILAAGKPFIAVAGGSRDLQGLAAEGAGIVVNNDATEVAGAMARLHAHPRIRQRMGKTARRIFEERYHARARHWSLR